MRQLLLQITVWEVNGGTKREDRARLWGLGTNWKNVFYGKLTRTTIPRILSVSQSKKKICKAVFS